MQSFTPCSYLSRAEIVLSKSSFIFFLSPLSSKLLFSTTVRRSENDCISSASLVSAATLRGSLSSSSDAAFFRIKLNVQTSTPVRDWKATIEFLSRGTQSLPAALSRPLTSSASSADAFAEARRAWALTRVSREAAMGARRNRADFLFCSRSNSFGPGKLKEKAAATGRAGEAARTRASSAARREETLGGGCEDSRKAEAAEVARRRSGAGGVLSEWMAGVGLMVVEGCCLSVGPQNLRLPQSSFVLYAR